MPSLAKVLGCFTCAQCVLFVLVGHYFHVFEGLQEDLRVPSKRNVRVPAAIQQAPAARDLSKRQQIVKIANANKHNPFFRKFSKSKKAKKFDAAPRPQQLATHEQRSHLGNIVYHMPPNSQPKAQEKVDIFIAIASSMYLG